MLQVMEEGEGDEMRLPMFQTLLEIITKVLRCFDSLAYELRDFKDNQYLVVLKYPS